MKKLMFTSLLLSLLFGVLCITANAEAETVKDYLITASGEELSLYQYNAGEANRLLTGGPSELFAAIISPDRIYADDIMIAEDTELPSGNYILSGRMTVTNGARLAVPAGATVSFKDFSLMLQRDSLIRVKGGELTVDNSRIISDSGTAVRLDYSALSSLVLKKGEIKSDSATAVVELLSGTAELIDGIIENKSGSAVENRATLYLCGTAKLIGAGDDIRTSRAIHLSNGNSRFSSAEPLKVRFTDEFHDGSLTELFYGAKGVNYSNIRVISDSGMECTLSYFESCDHTAERDFLAVYLPFTVKIFDGGKLIATEQRLNGETLSFTSMEEKPGYTQGGIYKDELFLIPFSQEERITSDMKLYLKYNLNPPSFTIKSMDITYSDKTTYLSFDSVIHPLEKEGFYTCEWYKDGEKVGNGKSLALKNVKDSGKYSCFLTFHYLSDSVTVYAEGITVKINKAVLDTPIIPPSAYTSFALFPEIQDSSLYSFGEQSFTECGIYDITLTLTDCENYRWRESDTKEVTASFEITKAVNKFIKEPSAENVYYGMSLKLHSQAFFGRPVYLFSSSKDGEYTNVPPSDVGKYYVKAIVEGTSNYSELCSPPVCFSILPERAVSLKVMSQAAKKSYHSFELFDLKELSLGVVYNSGREEIVPKERIAVRYQNGNTFLYGDTGIVLSFDGISIIYPIEVEKCEYDISSIDFSDINKDFDGKYHSFEYKGEEILGKDGLPLRLIISGGGSNAGEYEIDISFSSDSKEYRLPQAKTVRLTVNPRNITLSWGMTVFVYDGKSKCPEAYYFDVLGVKRYPELCGASVFAGDGYVARAETADKNYLLLNNECEYTVLKADYDLSNVYFSKEKFVYDGEEKTVTAEGLPDGVAAVGYTDNRHTDSGVYKLTVSFSYDERNYNSPGPLTYMWQILPAEYDMTGVSFFDTSSLYDGKIHYPTVDGDMPTGIDGSVPRYEFSAGARDVKDGKVAVKIIFTSGSKNYDPPDSVTRYVEILPRGIEVIWTAEEYVYNGSMMSPSASATECTLTVLGGATDAGEYTARAVCDDNNYFVINDLLDFTIKKAQNSFITPLTVEDIFEGREVFANAVSVFGIVKYRFYLEEKCENEVVMPLDAGVYFCVAEVEESKNYMLLSSAPVRFEIKEILPVSISARLLTSKFVAFYKLTSSDIEVRIRYNDESESVAEAGKIMFSYTNGDSLRRSDSSVYVHCEGMTLELPLKVDYADYDLSKIYWENAECIYNGEPKIPTLCGLPEGLKVMGYSGYGTNAGSYTVNVLLDYDRENYNEPKPDPCFMKIAKATVFVPSYSAVTYSGRVQLPVSNSALYKINCDGEVKNAGVYDLILTLNDGNNYTFFESADESIRIKFTVLPIKLSLNVSDYDRYLFSEIEEIDYKIISGRILEGDTVMVKQRIEDDRIVICSLNPNYVFENNVARINRIGRLSPETVEKLLIYSLLSLLLILLFITVVLNRDRIAARLIYLREKRSPEKMQYVLKENIAKPALPEPKAVDEREDIILSEDAMSVDKEHADELISDALAKDLLKRSREAVYTSGSRKEIINVDIINENFEPGERVDVNKLKEKGLISEDTAYIKILARGVMNKPLSVYANDFSLSAIKMIALTGGKSFKVITVKISDKRSFDRFEL